MPYLNLDLDYFTHPKTMRLIGLLGKGSEVLPIKLWCHAGKHHAGTGKLSGYSPKEIEAVVGWWGSEGSFVEAMIHVGFMIDNEGNYELHEWKDHEGHLVMFKKRAKRAALARWSKDATSTAKGMLEQSPILSLPNRTKPTNKNGVAVEIPDDLKDSEAEVRDWLEYKRQKGQSYKPKGLEALWRTFRAIPREHRRSSVDLSMSNNWSGLFEKKGESKPDETQRELERRRELSEQADRIIAAQPKRFT